MHGVVAYPSLVPAAPVSPVLLPSAWEIAVGKVPGLRYVWEPSPDWYDPADGPYGDGWYSRHLPGKDSAAFLRPFAGFEGEDGAPTFNAGGIGDGDSLTFDGFYNALVPITGMPFAFNAESDPTYDTLSVNLAEGFLLFVLATTEDSNRYVIAPPARPTTTFSGNTMVPFIQLIAGGGGATQTVRVLGGNGTVNLGGTGGDAFTGVGSVMITWSASEGRKLIINGAVTDTEAGMTDPMHTGRFQLGRRGFSPYTGTPPSEVYTSYKGEMGPVIIGDIDISKSAYEDEYDDLFTELHTKWGGSGGLPAYSP